MRIFNCNVTFQTGYFIFNFYCNFLEIKKVLYCIGLDWIVITDASDEEKEKRSNTYPVPVT